MNNLFNSKTTTIILVLLLIALVVIGFFILQNNSEPTVAPIEEPIVDDPVVVEEPEEETPVEEEIPINADDNILNEVKVMDRPPALTLETHEPLSDTEKQLKIGGSMLSPIYRETWRLQPIDYNYSSSGVSAVFEFGNTGSTDIVITSDNIHFTLDADGGADLAKSKIVGEPIVVKPNELTQFTVTAEHPNAGAIDIRIEGQNHRMLFYQKDSYITEEINDTEPYVGPSNIDAIGPFSRYMFGVFGNGKFKIQTTEVIMTENKVLGDTVIPDGSMLVLVKVRLANTSDQVMNISKIQIGSINGDLETEVLYTGAFDEQLVPNQLPSKIEPQTIVEGYIPAIIKDSNELSDVIFESNLGPFEIQGVETYTPWL